MTPMRLKSNKFFSAVQGNAEKRDELRAKPKAEKQLVIYFTPRSGSSWLTEVLSQTNRLGRANEVFNPDFIPSIAQSCHAETLEDYIDLVQRRMNVHNVFSFEITWHQLGAVFGDGATFMRSFGAAKPVWLLRHDIVAQAVSLAKMVTTAVAHTPAADAEQRAEADRVFAYNPALIRKWLNHILVAERGTEAHFAANDMQPLRLSYEEITAAGAETMRARFAQYMNVARLPDVAAPPLHSKLATFQNADYAARFRRDEADFLQDVARERADWLAATTRQENAAQGR